MCHYLSLTDLFLVGLALDVVGAVILAKALLLKPETIFRMSTNYPGTNAYLVVDRAEQRVAAEFGMGYLAGGFVLQLVGYGAELAGVNSASGSTRLLVALALASAFAGVASLIWARYAKPRTDAIFNRVSQLQYAEEKSEWRNLNGERRKRGEDPTPLPGHLKDVPDPPWIEDAEK